MAGKFKCSYEDCYRTFKSQALMIQHKIKEPAHEYCKRCDVDYEDDMAYLIHQMNNPKHIACCICGEEFKSEAGRDAHVELYHKRNQNLPCPGCATIFPKAGALMHHIEKDECEVISAEVYQRRMAEKQIEKDVWAEALDSSNMRSFLPSQADAGSEADTNGGGVSLLDDYHVRSSGQTWQGATPQTDSHIPLQPTISGPYTAPRPAVQSKGTLSLDKYPSLPAQNKTPTTQSMIVENPPNGDDLLLFDDAETKQRKAVGGPWNFGTVPASLFVAPRTASPKSGESHDGSTLDNSSNVSTGTKANAPISMFDRLSQLSVANSRLSSQAQSIPPAALPPNTNPTGRMRTIPAALSGRSTLDPWKYFDHLQNCFVCPGAKCRAKYATPKDFDEHLVSSAHVGGKTVCPSCLSKFNTNAALISHCESGSKRCTIRKSANYNQVMRELTAGLLGTEGHLIDGSVKYVASKPQDW